MLRGIPPFVKDISRYNRYAPNGNRFMWIEEEILNFLRQVSELTMYRPPSCKPPVGNSSATVADNQLQIFSNPNDGNLVVRPATARQFLDFRLYGSENPGASLALDMAPLDRILLTILKLRLFYYFRWSVGHVNASLQSVLLFHESSLEGFEGNSLFSMAFTDFEASFSTRETTDHWIGRAVMYARQSNCVPPPEFGVAAADGGARYDPLALILFYVGHLWHEALLFEKYGGGRSVPLPFNLYNQPPPPLFRERGVNEDDFFPKEHLTERYFFRHLVTKASWRTLSDPDLFTFCKLAATLVYLLHNDPTKRFFAMGIWCGNSPPQSSWSFLENGDLSESVTLWIHEPWTELSVFRDTIEELELPCTHGHDFNNLPAHPWWYMQHNIPLDNHSPDLIKQQSETLLRYLDAISAIPSSSSRLWAEIETQLLQAQWTVESIHQFKHAILWILSNLRLPPNGGDFGDHRRMIFLSQWQTVFTSPHVTHETVMPSLRAMIREDIVIPFDIADTFTNLWARIPGEVRRTIGLNATELVTDDSDEPLDAMDVDH